ncbi:PREDICTED: uncharacterized protein LOC109487737 [Branchiostoma belcheri]|uniref:Uncharacterized protein LOC109487737 n=1 Tax=Branchiostoma belcheri TaxID=7741 RepID=A0A6P5AWB3_BRABE|nr:PREDICTED: uncharacterized protein LOC109487737 [Branchiostoma belcheri]
MALLQQRTLVPLGLALLALAGLSIIFGITAEAIQGGAANRHKFTYKSSPLYYSPIWAGILIIFTGLVSISSGKDRFGVFKLSMVLTLSTVAYVAALAAFLIATVALAFIPHEYPYYCLRGFNDLARSGAYSDRLCAGMKGMMGLALILAILELVIILLIMFITCKLLREKDQWAAKQRTTRMAPQPDGMVILTQYPDPKPPNGNKTAGYDNGTYSAP